MKVGDKVIRLPPPKKLGSLRKGHQYFSLAEGEVAVVVEIDGDSVYLEGKGGWPHHIKTLKVL